MNEAPIIDFITETTRSDASVLFNHIISYVWTPKVFSRLECVSKGFLKRMQDDSVYQAAIAHMFPDLTMTAPEGQAKLLYSTMAATYANGNCLGYPGCVSFNRYKDTFLRQPDVCGYEDADRRLFHLTFYKDDEGTCYHGLQRFSSALTMMKGSEFIAGLPVHEFTNEMRDRGDRKNFLTDCPLCPANATAHPVLEVDLSNSSLGTTRVQLIRNSAALRRFWPNGPVEQLEGYKSDEVAAAQVPQTPWGTTPIISVSCADGCGYSLSLPLCIQTPQKCTSFWCGRKNSSFWGDDDSITFCTTCKKVHYCADCEVVCDQCHKSYCNDCGHNDDHHRLL